MRELPMFLIMGPSHSEPSLDTPLAGMLPSKYRGVDVTEIFPEFKKGQVLRFSRLFGAGKPSHLPQPYKHLKNNVIKKVRIDDDGASASKEAEKEPEAKGDEPMDVQPSVSGDDDSQGDTSQDEDSQDPFELDLGDSPTESQVATDDEDILTGEIELKRYDEQQSSKKAETSPKIADWRYGPAQYWYDFIGVSESGEGFDYGMKLKAAEDTIPKSEETPKPFYGPEEPDPDEAYHLVTQIQWEDDIIWNGEDIKAKVQAKLNDKTHAAGWVPSGLNRTASAFTSQAKGSLPKTVATPQPTPGPSGVNTKSAKGDKMSKSAAAAAAAALEAEKEDEMWYSIFPVENEELVYGTWEDDIIWGR